MEDNGSSSVTLPPIGTLHPRLRPWEVMDWSPEQRRSIYCSWAQKFATSRQNSAAMKYFDKCIDESDVHGSLALCMRSNFNRAMAKPEAALRDSIKASDIARHPLNASVNVQIADALYDLNKFEENKTTLHDSLRLYVGTRQLPFQHRLTIVNGNFEDSVGPHLSPFFLLNAGLIKSMQNKLSRKQSDQGERMPYWKYREELEDKCDVQSIADKKEIKISPLEMARRKRKTKIFFQNYLNQAWTDIAFLKTMRHNPIVLLNRYFSMASEQSNYMNDSYSMVKRFTKMLHARSPIYNEIYRRNANRELAEQFHQANMYRIQYQTRRNMLSILRTIRTLRQDKDVPRLRQYVSKVMGKYNVLKTHRVMPWKTEFMNEVYNHFALSLCEEYRVPRFKVSPYNNDSMCHLLGVSPLKPGEQTQVVFGERSTYPSEDSGSPFEHSKSYKLTCC